MDPSPTMHSSYAGRGVNPDRMDAIDRHAVGAVLDVGCGSGAYVNALGQNRLAIGIDRSSFGTWSTSDARFVRGDAGRLPFRDSSVDTLLVFETLEHLEAPEIALAEYRRVTRQRLILTVPNCANTPGMLASNVIFGHWIDPTHVSFWDLAAIASLVESSGFSVRERELINRIDPVPFIAEALGVPAIGRRAVRWLERRRRAGHRMTSLVVADKRPGG